MFLRFDIGFDAEAWTGFQEHAAARLQAVDEALASQGWTLYLLWASSGESSGFVVAGAPAGAAEPEGIASVVADRTRAELTEISNVDVVIPSDRPVLDAERWELVTTAAVRGPDATCVKCGGIPPDHNDECELRRVHDPLLAPAVPVSG